jgi:hypothetical protein
MYFEKEKKRYRGKKMKIRCFTLDVAMLSPLLPVAAEVPTIGM